MESFNKFVSPHLSFLDRGSKNYNEIVSTCLIIFLVLYGGLAAPKLPKNIAEAIAGNPFVKIIAISGIVWLMTNRRNPALAILIATTFVLTMVVLNKHSLHNLVSSIPKQVSVVENRDGVNEDVVIGIDPMSIRRRMNSHRCGVSQLCL